MKLHLMCSLTKRMQYFSSLSVKTHFFLVATLNKSFHPDYCFSSTPSTDFSRELNLNSVVNSVDSLLLTLGGTYYSSMFKPKLWEEIDREISLKDCEIYKYCPDLNCGPFGEPGNNKFLSSFFNYIKSRALSDIDPPKK